jgi:hypothetical protein
MALNQLLLMNDFLEIINKMTDTQRAISLFDLKKVPGAVGIIQRNNKKEVEALLNQYGFDVDAGYEFEDCWHRPLTQVGNQAVYGVRIVGLERTDPSWIKSGNASWEARVEALSDPELRADLKKMGRVSCEDRAFTDEEAAKQFIKKEKNKYKEDKE